MMKSSRIILIGVCFIVAFFYWYFFIDTLRFSQIAGNTKNPYASIFINIIDFNTGLTRYDIYNLSRKNEYWQRRISEINEIHDIEKRNLENAKLLAEMMNDPSINKIVKKFTGFGTEATFSILQAIK